MGEEENKVEEIVRIAFSGGIAEIKISENSNVAASGMKPEDMKYFFDTARELYQDGNYRWHHAAEKIAEKLTPNQLFYLIGEGIRRIVTSYNDFMREKQIADSMCDSPSGDCKDCDDKNCSCIKVPQVNSPIGLLNKDKNPELFEKEDDNGE